MEERKEFIEKEREEKVSISLGAVVINHWLHRNLKSVLSRRKKRKSVAN